MPTPLDVARRRPAPPAPAPVVAAPAATAATVPSTFVATWTGHLAASRVHRNLFAVGVVLARFADPATGELGVRTPGQRQLHTHTSLTRSTVRDAVFALEQGGWIVRRPYGPGEPKTITRPIRLTLPAAGR